MKKDNEETQEVQGTEVKKTIRSPLYIIKVFGEHVKKVEDAKLLPKKELDELKVLHQKMIQYFMGEPML